MGRDSFVRTALRRSRPLLAGALVVAAVIAPADAAAAGARPAAGQLAACGRTCLAGHLRADLAEYLAVLGGSEHVSAGAVSVRLPGDGGTVDVAAGTTRVGGAQPVTTDTLWQVGSNTKAFTSVMLLQLEAEGRLSIHDTLGSWLPQYPQWRHVTIQRLLDMTSGIPTYDESPAFLRDYLADPHRRFTERQLVAYAVPLSPTQGYSYSNTNYVLAEMVVEKATHDTYGHQLRRRFLGPLHLRDTVYRPHLYPAAVTAREPAGYFADRSVRPLRDLLGHDVSGQTLSWARGAGGVISTTHDLTVWEHALYSGRLLPARQQRELRSLVSAVTGLPIARTSLSDPLGFGLGIAQLTDSTLGRVWFYEGETLGFRTVHMFFPRSGVLLAAALNSEPTVDHISDLVGLVYTTLVDDGVIGASAPGTSAAFRRHG